MAFYATRHLLLMFWIAMLQNNVSVLLLDVVKDFIDQLIYIENNEVFVEVS